MPKTGQRTRHGARHDLEDDSSFYSADTPISELEVLGLDSDSGSWECVSVSTRSTADSLAESEGPATPQYGSTGYDSDFEQIRIFPAKRTIRDKPSNVWILGSERSIPQHRQPAESAWVQVGSSRQWIYRINDTAYLQTPGRDGQLITAVEHPSPARSEHPGPFGNLKIGEDGQAPWKFNEDSQTLYLEVEGQEPIPLFPGLASVLRQRSKVTSSGEVEESQSRAQSQAMGSGSRC